MTEQTLNVQGMSCGHCVNSIEGSVGALNGVESVNVHLQDGKVELIFDREKVDLQDIIEAIEEQGYNVTK